MSQFYVVSESTEDTLATADNLQDAIRFAQEAARQGRVGDPVCVLESGGKAVRQFVLMADGTVAELPIAAPTQSVAVVSWPNVAEPAAAADGGRSAG